MQSPTSPGCPPTDTVRAGPAAAGPAAVARRFPATAGSVGEARRFLLEQLPEGCGGVDALVLMLSEVATNAVRHAATSYEVSVHLAGDPWSVRVEVNDAGGGFPARHEPLVDAPRGRGLHIVGTLSDAWGIEMQRDGAGKTVWFSSALPATAGPPQFVL